MLKKYLSFLSIKKHPQKMRFKDVLYLPIDFSSKKNKSGLKAF